MTEEEPDGRQNGHSFTLTRLPNSTSILFASGHIDDANSSIMGRLVADELARRPGQLVLELSRATSVVGSAFIETLAEVSAIAGEADTSFCLVVLPDGPVADALATAGLIERFEIFTTLRKAEQAGGLDALGTAVIEQSRRATARAQKATEAARIACEHSQRLRRTRPRAPRHQHPGAADPQV
ncbi:MAG: hypothetical protein AB1925_09815 [Actinomycetota bacterium]